jgi:hypothetical protein
MKRQHIKSMHDKYTKHKTEFESRQKAIEEGKKVGPFAFQADLETLSSPTMPLKKLEEQVFDHIFVTGRPLALVSAITHAITALEDEITLRNNIIKDYKAKGRNEDLLIRLYFGLPKEDGVTDVSFVQSTEAIHNLTEDGIFFSSLLAEDLADHASALKSKYETLFGKKGSPPTGRPDFSKAEREGLMPDRSQYKDWLNKVPRPGRP